MDELPAFEYSHNDPLADPLQYMTKSRRYAWPDPGRSSPTSSNEALSNGIRFNGVSLPVEHGHFEEDDWDSRNMNTTRGSDSPPGSTSEEDVNPFYDEKTKVEPVVEEEKAEGVVPIVVDEIPVDESTLNEIDL